MMRLTILAAMLALTPPVAAETAMQDRFDNAPHTRWRFFTDQVMGGVSQGQVRFHEQAGATVLHLTGKVSTENNGGFIQARADLAPPGSSATGVRIVARGNGERYFIHLRTSGTILPWQYYQAGFSTGPDWQEIRLPFSAFKASGRLLRARPAPRTLRSIAIVAFGKDYSADLEVREIGLY